MDQRKIEMEAPDPLPDRAARINEFEDKLVSGTMVARNIRIYGHMITRLEHTTVYKRLETISRNPTG